jgi:hypothetical protein
MRTWAEMVRDVATVPSGQLFWLMLLANATANRTVSRSIERNARRFENVIRLELRKRKET